MKITILKNKFAKGLGIVEKITGKNFTLPILGNVLINTEDSAIKLSTTDLEVGISYWIMAKIEDKGKITIPVRPLSNFVSLISEEQINLETKDNTLFLKGELYKSQIKGLDAEDFPIIPEVSENIWVEIDSKLFSQAMLQVIDFCALTQTRLELSGIYLSFEKGQLKIVATDSFRLAEKTISTSAVSNDFTPQSFILPRNAAREMINIFSQEEGMVKFYLSPNQIMAEKRFPDSSQPKIRLVTRLIEGEYPSYKEVIPKETKTKISLKKDELFNQIKKASLFSGKSNEVSLDIEPKKDEITFFSQNVDLGEIKSKTKADIKGEKVEIRFNYKFLSEGVNQINSDKIVLGLNGSDGPGLIKPVGDNSFLYVIMPIKSS